MERLQKLLSQAGVASRREAEKLIIAGRISVDGRVAKLGDQAESTHNICLDGKPIGKKAEALYFLLNKPKGYLCTVKDDRGRKTVLDLFSDVSEYIYPVGRLDYNTEGLLLLTNDGEFMNGILHPSHEVKKTYVAKVRGIPNEKDMKAIRTGIALADGMTAPAEAKFLEKEANGAWSRISLTIHEGKNRQVRRMMERINHEVLSLKRTCFAGLTLEGVGKGKYRELTKAEVDGLYSLFQGSAKNG